MAGNVDDNDPVMKMYEALAIAEERNQEIERLRREIEELRGNRQGSSHSPGSQGDSNAESSPSLGAANSEASLSLSLLAVLPFSPFSDQQNTHSNLSGEDKVNIAINAITQAVVELRNTVRGLAERVEEISDNCRVNQRRLQGRLDSETAENRTRLDGLQIDNKEIEEKNKEILARITSIDKKMEERIDKEIQERIDSINKNVEGKIGPMRHSTAVLSNSQILLLGGADGRGMVKSDIFLQDYATKKWTILPITMPYLVANHGTLIVNDELYIIGGDSGNGIDRSSVQRLNKQLKWEKRTDMNEARQGIQYSSVVYDNCIWVFGGRRRENETWITFNTVEKYDPKTDKWEKKPEMKTKRGWAAAAVIKNKIYVCGGHDGTKALDSVEVFDTTSEVWTDFCTMPEPRVSSCVVVEGTSIILIGGGFNTKEQKTVWKMEEKEKKWTDLPPLNQARSVASAVKIGRGYILVTGGRTVKIDGYIDQILNSVEIFDGQKWNEFSSLPEGRVCHTTCLLTPPMIDVFNKLFD